MSTLYMGADRETIAKNVLFSGDPWRIEVIKDYLQDVKKVAFRREFNTYTGFYKGIPITVTSTGIGAPSAAIAMEEMYSCGMEVAVRMGTVMGLKENLLGKYIIPVAALRREGTSHTYADPSYPAVADIELLQAMNQAVTRAGKEFTNGLNCTLDGFYSQMKESPFSKKRQKDIQQTFLELKKLGVDGIDMESSCMLTVGRLMGVKTCILTLVTVLENLKDSLQSEERQRAEESLCHIALEGILCFQNTKINTFFSGGNI